MEITKKRSKNKKVNIFTIILIGIISITVITIAIIIYLEINKNQQKNSLPKIILTHYAIEPYSQMASNKEAFQTYLKDIIINFCKYRGISVFAMFLDKSFTKDTIQRFPWYEENEWIYHNFIKLCYDNDIEPAFNVYPNFKDSNWKDKDINPKDNETWRKIGQKIKEINDYSKTQNPNYIVKWLIYDNEACNCISSKWKGDPVVFVRNELKIGYPDLPNDFRILSSGGVGQAFKNKTGYDIGLGEVYWNIGQAEPCVGNASQYNNYAPVCKEGSSHRRYVNQPKDYLEFLVSSSKQSGTSLPIKNYKKGNTVPLFSTESLYSENGTIGRCAQLSYWGKHSNSKLNPKTSNKICGTFDGFSYWDWDKFREFLSLYSQKFDCEYVGIYDAMFIPSNWMKGRKFQNYKYDPNLGQTWPLNIPQQPEIYNNPQNYVNNWIMKPDGDNNTSFKYNSDSKNLCLADDKNTTCKNEVRLNLCPNFMKFDEKSNTCK